MAHMVITSRAGTSVHRFYYEKVVIVETGCDD